MPIPVAARYKAGLLGLGVRIPPDAWKTFDCYVLTEFSATGRSLFRQTVIECGVSECDREASIIRWPWPTWGCRVMWRKKYTIGIFINYYQRQSLLLPVNAVT